MRMIETDREQYEEIFLPFVFNILTSNVSIDLNTGIADSLEAIENAYDIIPENSNAHWMITTYEMKGSDMFNFCEYVPGTRVETAMEFGMFWWNRNLNVGIPQLKILTLQDLMYTS